MQNDGPKPATVAGSEVSRNIVSKEPKLQNNSLLRLSDGQRVNNNLAENTVLLAGTDDLGVHSHQVVVDGVLLLLSGFLHGRCLLEGYSRLWWLDIPGRPCTCAIAPQEQRSPQQRIQRKPSSLLRGIVR